MRTQLRVSESAFHGDVCGWKPVERTESLTFCSARERGADVILAPAVTAMLVPAERAYAILEHHLQDVLSQVSPDLEVVGDLLEIHSLLLLAGVSDPRCALPGTLREAAALIVADEALGVERLAISAFVDRLAPGR